jgi:endonuclease YncB( thermonuclease family)
MPPDPASGISVARDWRNQVLRPSSLWRAGSLALWLFAVAAPAAGAELVARVVSVYDGDTATVLDAGHTRYKIRLAGIDAPELHQAYGRVSQRHLSAATSKAGRSACR